MQSPQLLYLLVIHLCFPADDPTTPRTEMARTLVTNMADGKFDQAVEPFDQIMTKALPATKLQVVWEQITSKYGTFKRVTDTRTETVQKYKIVFVTCEFEQGKLDTKVVFTEQNKIAGLFFVPSGKYESPSYVDPQKFAEKDFTVGQGLLTLPGTLSLPQGDGPFPVVVLVHGSGPNDRDETVGSNKPFRDLAHGLASMGIAVLRYEKRTKHYPLAMSLLIASLTVKEETIDDVVDAVNGLKAYDKINPKQIFVLGHSMGGMLIPRIDKASDNIAGFISLAGSTRPIEDLILEQSKYIASLDGKATDETTKGLEQLQVQVAKIKSPELASEKGLILGASPKYWLDLRDYVPAQEAMLIKQPLLILQGERDYQVTMTDFANWKKALESRQDVKFISYPELNHLLIAGKGKSTPAEYLEPGNVSQKVVDDIAKWIKNGNSAPN